MEQTKEPKTSKGLVTFSHWVALAITALEMAVYLISFIPVVYCLRSFTLTPNIALKAFWLLSGYFGFQMYLVFVSAALARLLPRPKPGQYQLRDPKLNTIWMRDALSTLCYRTFVHSFANFFPFPGYFYYRLLGAKLHPDSTIDYSAKILSPYMVSLGRKVYIGTSAIISGHIVPDINSYVLDKVTIGPRVMIGANAFINPNVVIGNDSIITAGSVVIPGTRIPSGEVWGGNPARFIRKITEYREQSTENQSVIPAKAGIQNHWIPDQPSAVRNDKGSRHSEATEIVLEFISSKKGKELAKAITNKTPLFSSGLLDSLDFQELVSFLEKELSMDLSRVSISMDSMDTMEQIESMCPQSKKESEAKKNKK